MQRNPKAWRNLAEEYRILAEDAKHPITKASLINEAKSWDRIAEQAEMYEQQRTAAELGSG